MPSTPSSLPSMSRFTTDVAVMFDNEAVYDICRRSLDIERPSDPSLWSGDARRGRTAALLLQPAASQAVRDGRAAARALPRPH